MPMMIRPGTEIPMFYGSTPALPGVAINVDTLDAPQLIAEGWELVADEPGDDPGAIEETKKDQEA